MRSIIAALLLSLAAFAIAAPPPQAPASAHSHDHGEPASANEAPGTRWAADAPLRRAMQQIRDARAQAAGSPASDVELARAIDDAIAYMVANCSLPADADAALHGVIGDLSAAASALRRAPDPHAGIAMVDAALERYAQLFDESDRP